MSKTKNDTLVRETLRIYWQAVLRHPQEALIAAINPIGAVFMSILVPYFAGRVLARLAAHDAASAQTYIVYMAIAALIGLTLNRFGFTRLMLMQARVMSDLHALVFSRLLERSTSFHTNQISGKLVSDALDFVSSFSTLLMACFINGAPFLLIILSGLTIVFLNSWVLGLYLLAVVTFTLTWALVDSRRRSDLRTNRLLATKKLTSHLSDSIVNAQTVKTFARESDEIRYNAQLNGALRELRINDWQQAGRSGNNRIAALLGMQVVLLTIISHLASDNAILATGFFAFTYVFIITSRLFDINNLMRQIEDSLLQASPMTRMLLEDIEVADQPDAGPLQVSRGVISFSDVHFHYQDTSSDQTVFAGLDLDIKPGERIGLVGPSGGGKSTLTRLLLRFEDIDSGAITIDGQNIASVTQASLRQAVAYVPQEPLLFHRTIRENIAYGRPGASPAEVAAAADKAFATEFIRDLPKGFDTIVGERGVKLSGGQRQRVAIARAILKNAPILMLDEATSALDSQSEVMIQKALWALMQDRTAIVIAHRLSTIQKMDRILVMDNGTIAEQGSHDELLKKNGLYAKLWGHQSGGFIK